MVDAIKERDVNKLVSRVSAALQQLAKRGYSPEYAVKLALQDRGIPLSIFNARLGTLESIVKYMREELLLDYASIASMLGRDAGMIGVTYRNARKKHPAHLDISSNEHLSFDDLLDPRLSVLESISYHLALCGKDWHEVARIMHRHDKTIWTVLDRAKKKLRRLSPG